MHNYKKSRHGKKTGRKYEKIVTFLYSGSMNVIFFLLLFIIFQISLTAHIHNEKKNKLY